MKNTIFAVIVCCLYVAAMGEIVFGSCKTAFVLGVIGLFIERLFVARRAY